MSWTNEDSWSGMLSGDACPMCQDVHLEENPHSYLVQEFPSSFFRLTKNQDIHGRTLVALKRHANELHELSPEEISIFWNEVACASRAVHGVFAPVKLYYGVFGGRCPHLHCHILPMRREDDPHGQLAMGQREVLLEQAEYGRMIDALREKLR